MNKNDKQIREWYLSIATKIADFDSVWATPTVCTDSEEPAFIRAYWNTIPF